MRSYFKKMVLSLLFFISFNLYAATPSWQIVPNDSSITFVATQNNAPVSGKFKTFTGDIQFDPAALDSSSVKIIIDMGSVFTSYDEVMNALRTADWFNIKLFPHAIFQADHFKKIHDKTYQAEGTLTIRDKTVPVTVTFVLDEYSPTKARVTGSTVLKRSVFGVGQGDWAKTDTVKDEVEVKFTLAAVRKP